MLKSSTLGSGKRSAAVATSRGELEGGLQFEYGADDESCALHRVVVAATANGDGEATVEVRPHVRPGWQPVAPATSRVVQLDRPAARMVIEPESWQAPVVRGRRGQVSFRAIQTL